MIRSALRSGRPLAATFRAPHHGRNSSTLRSVTAFPLVDDSRVGSAPVTTTPVFARSVAPSPFLRRHLHTSRPTENLPLFIGIGVAGTAMLAKYAVQAYPAWKENRERTKAHFRSPYKGGFEEEMTRREAALILGVRESASKDRIKQRHRELLMQNHPDKGGSTFIASKINEAKEMMMNSGM